jgi:hypothetical protein
MIKTFRGILADGGQDHIRLKTNKGDIGYRIVKFEIFPNLPGTVQQESTVAIWKLQQTTVSTSTATIDFTDGDLLAAAHYQDSSSVDNPPGPLIVTFDHEVFNQDIYITHTETTDAQKINYYIELEQIKLNENESAMATLQSIRDVGETRSFA